MSSVFSIGCVHLVNLIDFIRFHSELSGKVLLNIEVILRVGIGQIPVVRVLGYVVLARHKRTHTTKLEDTFAAVEDGKLIYRCKVFTELLIIERVGNLSASALAGIIVE